MNKIPNERIVQLTLDILSESDISKITPKNIRSQIENSLDIPSDSLKDRKQLILDTIIQYSRSEHRGVPQKSQASKDKSVQNQSEDLQALKQLSRFVKALGKGPTVFKDLTNLGPSEKHKIILKRLRDAGVAGFSDIPTDFEINKAQRRRDRERELEDINTDVIIPEGRKRGADANKSSVINEFLSKRPAYNNKENMQVQDHLTVTPSIPILLPDSEEEAELDL